MAVEEYTDWCRSMFEILAEGGVWGIPRSATVFRKEGDALVLVDLPYDRLMPCSEEEYRATVDSEFETVREHFAAAGIEVRR